MVVLTIQGQIPHELLGTGASDDNDYSSTVTLLEVDKGHQGSGLPT